MSIAALVLGIVGLVASFVPCLGMYAIPLTLLGVLFGALGLRRPKDGTPPSGRGMAIAGLICGAIGTLIAIYWIYVYVTVGPVLKKGIQDEFQKEMQRQEQKLEAEKARLDKAGKPDVEKPATTDPAGSDTEKKDH
jgi:hypothetical protein